MGREGIKSHRWSSGGFFSESTLTLRESDNNIPTEGERPTLVYILRKRTPCYNRGHQTLFVFFNRNGLDFRGL